MQTRRHADDSASESWMMRAVHAWAVGAAVVFGLLGLVLLLAGAENGPPWQKADAIFGVSTRTVLRVGGSVHLLLAGYMAFARNPLSQGLLALWLGLNYTVYRIGLMWMGAESPLPVLQCTGDAVGIKPQTLSTSWTWFTVYLMAGGVLLLLVEWRRWKRIEAESFMERWREMRQQSGGGVGVGRTEHGQAATVSHGSAKSDV